MEHFYPEIKSRAAFRAWLEQNAKTECECFLQLRRGKPTEENCLWYLDAVEEALCFGWIDSVQKKVDGVLVQRFSPRKPNGLWTELNKARVRRLEKLGLMTDGGRAVCPPTNAPFVPDADVTAELKKAKVWNVFCTFPPLYQRVRLYNVAFYKKRDPKAYSRALNNLIEQTRKGKMFGEWNDYGRLTEE
ncbi:MAG TPA: thymidylate synthase [Clostridiales bacterium]|nr:thymidylate synthase [Clostridiales bacterium]